MGSILPFFILFLPKKVHCASFWWVVTIKEESLLVNTFVRNKLVLKLSIGGGQNISLSRVDFAVFLGYLGLYCLCVNSALTDSLLTCNKEFNKKLWTFKVGVFRRLPESFRRCCYLWIIIIFLRWVCVRWGSSSESRRAFFIYTYWGAKMKALVELGRTPKREGRRHTACTTLLLSVLHTHITWLAFFFGPSVVNGTQRRKKMFFWNNNMCLFQSGKDIPPFVRLSLRTLQYLVRIIIALSFDDQACCLLLRMNKNDGGPIFIGTRPACITASFSKHKQSGFFATPNWPLITHSWRRQQAWILKVRPPRSLAERLSRMLTLIPRTLFSAFRSFPCCHWPLWLLVASI